MTMLYPRLCYNGSVIKGMDCIWLVGMWSLGKSVILSQYLQKKSIPQMRLVNIKEIFCKRGFVCLI